MTDTVHQIANLPELATPSEVARVLRCSPRYVQNQCARGNIKAAIIAGRYLITRDAVTDYLNRQKVRPCRSETQELGSSGVRTALSGRSSGTREAADDVGAQALMIANKLIKSSQRSSSKAESTRGQMGRVIPING